jgi:hypothetical protein
MRTLASLVFAAALLAAGASAQDAAHNLDAFAPLDLPTATDVRSSQGVPGEDYWQQRADYALDASLDPEAKRLAGTVTITYTNNSPDDLPYLWLHLEQNLFRPGSRGATMQPADSRWRGSFPGGGLDLVSVEMQRADDSFAPAEHLVAGTRLKVTPQQPVAAEGGVVRLRIGYAFTIPQYGADRMGWLDVERGTVFELAQWFPRMAVYDDVHGWNALPYLGQGEFYLDYGDYDLALTVPRDFIVVATGALLNPGDVLTGEQMRRMEAARQSEETVHIIAPEEVGASGTRPAGSGPLTWRYRATDVRDVAWAASEAFIWDAADASSEGTEVLAQSVYPHEGIGTEDNPGWERSTEYVQHSIRYYSDKWLPYPYPVAINVAGVVGGMEYPMVAFCSVRARGEALFGVTDHELGHIWYPMIVGSDERRYAWMDEGFNTFINYYSTLDFYGGATSRTQRLSGDQIAEWMQADYADQPIATYPDRIRRAGLGFLAYRKPAAGLRILREVILGEERFDQAFRAYTEAWAYKHPQPADFFRAMENAAGEDLDWFWRGWFYSTDTFDQAIAEVANDEGALVVTVENRGELILPATLAVERRGGLTERVTIPAEAWATGDTFSLRLEDAATIASLHLDPDGVLPDVDRTNDRFAYETPPIMPGRDQ